jgi:predicted transcriptional regulator
MIETTALHKYLFSIHRIVMKYRSRTDITVLILEAANGGATKTKIMYKSFLSTVERIPYNAIGK